MSAMEILAALIVGWFAGTTLVFLGLLLWDHMSRRRRR